MLYHEVHLICDFVFIQKCRSKIPELSSLGLLARPTHTPVMFPLVTLWSRVLHKLIVTRQVNTPSFMESEESLPCSQQPTTGPYP